MELTKKNFNKEVLESKEPVLVDFWASWCGPCKMMGPVIEELEKEYKGKGIKIFKVNIDDNSDLAAKYHIMSIPTVLIFEQGKVKKQMVGFQTKEELKKIIDKLI